MLRKKETIIFIAIVLASVLLHAATFLVIAGQGGFLLPLHIIGNIDVEISEPPPPVTPPPSPALEREPTPPTARPAAPKEASKTEGKQAEPSAEAPPAPPAEGARGEAVAPAAPPTEKGAVPETTRQVRLARHQRETFHFDIYWSGIHVGQAVMEISAKEGEEKITSTVTSNAVISAFYQVEDYAESRVVNGRAISFKLKQSEGKHRGDKETRFDAAEGTVTFFNHLNQTSEKHPMREKRLWDVMSAFFYLRTQSLTVGKPVFIDMFDNNKFVSTEVEVLRTERKELPDGKEAEMILVKPVLKTEGLFKRTGDIFIWLTNDENKTPVRVETKIKIGKVTAELRKVEVRD
ncbi:MAG: DUF3108 domain-containing protein [Geobacter sp.]|nr:DUF3108 domain-containing protein [Geobacter sp.]